MTQHEIAIMRQLAKVWPSGLDADQLIDGSGGALSSKTVYGTLASLDDRSLIAGRSVLDKSHGYEWMRREYRLTSDGRSVLSKPAAIMALAEQRITVGDRLIVHGPPIGLALLLYAAVHALGASNLVFALFCLAGFPIGALSFKLVSEPWIDRRRKERGW